MLFLENLSRFKTEIANLQIEKAIQSQTELIRKIESGLTFEEEALIFSEINCGNLNSATLVITFWNYLLANGELRKSKKIFSLLTAQLYRIKNQTILETILNNASRFYTSEELQELELNINLFKGNVEKVDSLIEEKLSEDKIKYMARNLSFWATCSKKMKEKIANFSLESGNEWVYKITLKFLFESIIRQGVTETDERFLKNVKVKHRSDEHGFEFNDSSLDDESKIENQIKLMLKIGKKSKAMEIYQRITNQKLRMRMEKLLNIKNDVVPVVNKENSLIEIEATPNYLRPTIDKIYRALDAGGDVDKNYSFLNFCLASDLYEKALETIEMLLNKTEKDDELINLKFMKVQIYFLNNLKTQAILEINDLLSNQPLSNEEKKLADWYLKRIFGELNAR